MNRNVGRCFVRYPLRVYLTDANGSARYSAEDPSFDETTWIKGEEYPVTTIVSIPRDLAPGEYDLRIALTDANRAPRIRLGIAGDDGGRRFEVGKILITSTDVPAR